MKIRYVPDPVRYRRMDSSELREAFLIDTLFVPDTGTLFYFDVDRVIVGSVVPAREPLRLDPPKALSCSFFTEHREIGIFNIGGKGKISTDEKIHELENKDALYIGKGVREIKFSSEDFQNPAKFYLLSYPGHQAFPTQRIKRTEADSVQLGKSELANERTIHKLIHPGKVSTAQIVMGFTELKSGSVWNTMPPHLHGRRMEVYLYFDMEPNTRVFHFMGPPEETRHLVVANEQAVISPSWSIHAGVGTGPYRFCWGMGGENQDFDDMDPISMEVLR